MSPLPGGEVDLVDPPPSVSEFSDTGTAYWLSKADNDDDKALFAECRSIDQVRLTFGARDPSSPLYDSAETFFREGGSRLYLASVPVDGTEDDVIALIDEFMDPDYGPGQFAAPGITTVNLQKAIMGHCKLYNRRAVLDAPDSATVATLTTAAQSLTGQPGDRMASLWAPWDTIPGIALGADRTVPPSARICGNLARNDFRGIPRNQPAAGQWGIARRVKGLSQKKWSDADRLTLNDAGVNVSIMKWGRVRTYGIRTLASQATDADWSWWANSRAIMAVVTDLDVMKENFVFSMLDGQLVAIKKFVGAIVGVLDPYWRRGELYGMTANEAYSVDAGPAYNDVNTFANGELHARVGLRCSPAAERVYIDVSKVPITESLDLVMAAV